MKCGEKPTSGGIRYWLEGLLGGNWSQDKRLFSFLARLFGTAGLDGWTKSQTVFSLLIFTEDILRLFARVNYIK